MYDNGDDMAMVLLKHVWYCTYLQQVISVGTILPDIIKKRGGTKLMLLYRCLLKICPKLNFLEQVYLRNIKWGRMYKNRTDMGCWRWRMKVKLCVELRQGCDVNWCETPKVNFLTERMSSPLSHILLSKRFKLWWSYAF